MWYRSKSQSIYIEYKKCLLCRLKVYGRHELCSVHQASPRLSKTHTIDPEGLLNEYMNKYSGVFSSLRYTQEIQRQL